jgi:LCP family protein required for cell wall assembly
MESRMGKPKKKLPLYKRRGFVWTFLFFTVMMLAGASYYAYSFYNFTAEISNPKSSKTRSAEEWSGTERVNIALLGVDSRPGEGPPRADTMMILSVDPQTKTASLFSVMRDTYYPVAGYPGFRKINESYALGGPEGTVETLEKFLQIPIHYYVKTNFDGFAKIVDALGGIEMYVEKDMYWADDGIHDINLRKGYQHLDGKHALMYVRFRHDALADYTRTERQRNLLLTLAKELKSTNAILKLPDILKSVQNDIQTDMSLNDMLKLGRLAFNLDLSGMQSIQLPPLKDATGSKLALMDDIRDGMSVIIPDVYETRLLVHTILDTGKEIVRTYDDQAPMVKRVAENRSKQTTVPSVNGEGTVTPPIPKNGTGDAPVPEGTDPNRTNEATNPDGKNGTNTNSGTSGTTEPRTTEPPTPPVPTNGGTTQGGSSSGSKTIPNVSSPPPTTTQTE